MPAPYVTVRADLSGTPFGSPNLVANPGAEVDLAGWTAYMGTGGGAFARNVPPFVIRSGAGGFGVDNSPTGNGGGYYGGGETSISGLTIGKSYIFSVWAKSAVAGTQLSLYTGDANPVNAAFAMTTSWALYELPFVAAATSYSHIYVRSNTASATWWFDDVSVVRGAWTDLTPWLELGGDAGDIELTWSGRQDELSDDATPGGGSFCLKNPDGGLFTNVPGLIVDTDVHVQVLATYQQGATNFIRGDGYVDSAEPFFPGGGSDNSLLRIRFSDLSSRLGSGRPLLGMFDEEVRADNPICFYPLQESSNPANAGDLMNVAAPLVLTRSKYGPSTLTFGSNGPTFDRTAVAFDSATYGTSTTGPLSILKTRPGVGGPGMPPASGGFTFEMITGPLTAPAGNGYSVLGGLFSDDSNVLVKLEMFDAASPGGGGFSYFVVGDAPGSYSSAKGPSISDGPSHHLAGTVAADYKTVALWVDGVQYSADHTNGAALNLANLANILLGGQLLANGDSKNGVRGSVAAFALYAGVLSGARIQAHAAAALGNGPVERSDQRFTRIAGYGGLAPLGLPVGLATMGAQATRGRSIMDCLNEVGRTEGTIAYVTKAGQLGLKVRNGRYNAAVGLSLTSEDVGPGTIPRRDRLGLQNTRTASRTGGADQTYVNSASVTKRGTIDGGSLQVAPSTDAEALSNAAWRVTTHLTSQLRVPELVIDLRSRESQPFVENVLALDIDTLVQVTDLPPQTPGGTTATFFVEGGKEVLGPERWEITPFTSPQPRNADDTVMKTLRADASASAYTKLDAGLKIPL